MKNVESASKREAGSREVKTSCARQNVISLAIVGTLLSLSGCDGYTENEKSVRPSQGGVARVVSNSTTKVQSGSTNAKPGAAVRNPGNRLIRIMPFGDSITSGLTYRQPLWALMAKGDFPSVDYVGSFNGNSSPDGDHEGHPCYKISLLLEPAGTGSFKKCIPEDSSFGDARDLDIWFKSERPDIVLWHIGTNDVWNGQDTTTVMRAFTEALARLRQLNAHVTILVAQILPMTVADVVPLNTAITAWAKHHSTPDSRVVVVDMHTGFNSAWTTDGVHPNGIGSKWMADRWFSALDTILGNKSRR